MSQLHGRMPAILEREDFAAWLDVDGVDADEAVRLLRPAPDSKLELIEIGPAVNRAAYDDESLQRAVGEPIRAGVG
jgi:putative SOS response-associated peptidase YedK